MKLYEISYLISAKLTEEKAKNLSEKLITSIQEIGGILAEIKNPNKRKLAYPIKKENEGYLTSLNFYLDPESLANLEGKLATDSQILRYIILTKKILKKAEVPKELPKIKKIMKPEKEKVELEELEKKLEEILGES